MNRVRGLKNLVAWAAALFLALPLFACAPAAVTSGYTFTDARGVRVTVPHDPTRVVGLMGSYAHTWLLAGGTLAGVTADVLEEQRFPVGDNIQLVGSVKQPNLEAVLALQPQLVLLSPDIAGHIAAAVTLEAAGVPCAFFKVERFEDYLSMLRVLCDITGRDDLYEQNGAAVQAQIKACIDSAKQQPIVSVLFLRVFSTGAKAKADDNIVAYMLRDFGCKNIAEGNSALLGDAAGELSQEIVIKANPDVIVATSMGDEAKAQNTFDALLKTNGYKSLQCVRNGRTHMLPKQLFHYKPNERWGEAYAYLAEILFA